VLVYKKVPGRSWPTLEVQGLSKQESMKRRNESVDRYNALEKELVEAAKEKKHQMEKQAMEEQMALEKHQRKTIKHKKKAELEAAKDDLFEDLDEVNERDQQLLRGEVPAETTAQAQMRGGDADVQRQRRQYSKVTGEDIFGDEDCANQDEITVTKYKADE
jgi:hypothetical protein